MTVKKLIEVALPLEAINEASAREKSIRHGHPSTLHLWWSRKPTATARAVIWASVVDDPSSHPEQFPTEELQEKERGRLFKILERLVVWENSNDKALLEEARREMEKSTGGQLPKLLDPFAGGGSIPLEGQRLGLETYAQDLNPVAVMINKAMIEIPPLFADMIPVNPEARSEDLGLSVWEDARGLAEDVRYYGDMLKNEAFKKIGHLYPKAALPEEMGGGDAAVIAWKWARTVKCPNPACNSEVPLLSSLWLSKKSGKEVFVLPETKNESVQFTIHNNKKLLSNNIKQINAGTSYINEKGKGQKSTFRCPVCNNGIIKGDYANIQAANGAMSAAPVAVIAEGANGREYIAFDNIQREALNQAEKYYDIEGIDSLVPHEACRGTFASNALGRRYGFFEFKDYFTKRQLIALTTFCSLITDIQKKAETDALAAGLSDDQTPLSEGGKGAKAYAEAIGVYLAFAIDKLADRCSSICSWDSTRDGIRNTFARQAIPMVWDFAEGNPFCSSSGCFDNMLKWITESIETLPAKPGCHARQFDAQSDCELQDIMISTDPPYYDNIGYADLSDYFYVWMRQSLKDIYPKLFRTMLVPKKEELVATPYRFDGSKEKAKEFFEDGMYHALKQLDKNARNDIPVTIYYAFKQNDNESDGRVSSGWETMLSAIINAGFSITGTWPIRTELTNRMVGQDANALASSIVLVCRKRPQGVQPATRREFMRELKQELRPALRNLQQSSIAPVDLAQAAIGPAMAVFTKYPCVLEADGSATPVRTALKMINEELDEYFTEQEGELDAASRFCITIYSQYAYNNMPFGEADVLARAQNIAVDTLRAAGLVKSAHGHVALTERSELPGGMPHPENSVWLTTQRLAAAMAAGGIEKAAEFLAFVGGSAAEKARSLAYRLYTIADRKKWAGEAYAYNSLVTSWNDVALKAESFRNRHTQTSLFDGQL